MSAGGGWAEQGGDEHASTSASPIVPPPPPPRSPAPASQPGAAPTGGVNPASTATGPQSSALPPPGPPPAAKSPSLGKGAAAIGGVTLLAVAAVGGWLLTKPDQDERAAASIATDSAGANATLDPSEEPSQMPTSATESPEPSEAAEPTFRTFNDRVGDSRLRNEGTATSGSADVRAVHVYSPTAASPGWVVVELSAATPGVGVILRIDTDNDGWPDLTGWQHTATAASGSFRVADWSHGNDILMRSNEADEHFSAGDHQAPRSGVAFALRFKPGDLAGDRLRFNVQTVSDELYYDYAPGRQRWTHTSYELAW